LVVVAQVIKVHKEALVQILSLIPVRHLVVVAEDASLKTEQTEDQAVALETLVLLVELQHKLIVVGRLDTGIMAALLIQ
jgi:hypothetical protein